MSVAQSSVAPNLTLVRPGVTAPSAALARTRGVAFATDGYTTASDGTRLHYYTVGEGGPAIVCCDGIGCDGYAWKYVASDFAARHRSRRPQCIQPRRFALEPMQ